MDDIKRLLEALIFASPTPLGMADMAARLPEGVIILPALLSLQDDYAGRGVELVQRDGGWAFRTAPDLAPHMTLYRTEERKLTKAALETLSIIAYHQPVTRPEIENIRGVTTGKGTLDALLEAGWIKPGRRREVPGRPLTWVTSQAFLDYFSLPSLSDLPGLADMKAAGLLDRRAARDVVPGVSGMEAPADDAQDLFATGQISDNTSQSEELEYVA
jgi:segregation and condensation protein B